MRKRSKVQGNINFKETIPPQINLQVEVSHLTTLS